MASRKPRIPKSKESELRPRYIAAEHALYVGDKLIRKFKHPSPRQEGVIAAFEKAGWPTQIANPFANPTSLAKQHKAKQFLHDAIKRLNETQTVITFHGSGDGLGVSWEWRRKSAPGLPQQDG